MPETNYLSEDGAKRLVANIYEFWAQRGYQVHLEIVPVTLAHGHEAHGSRCFIVQSDMVNGLPRQIAGYGFGS